MKTKIVRNLVFIVFSLILKSLWATGNGAGITYQGLLLNPNGDPVTSASVQFRIQIRTPNTENCLMYEEAQIKDLSTTNGVFSITINDGSGSRLDSSGFTLDQIFANRGTFNFTTGNCTAGSNFTPNSTDSRKIQILFNDGQIPEGQWETIPSMAINFAPTAIEALQVGGYKKEQLLKIAEGVSVTGTELNSTDWANFLALLQGTSTQYPSQNSFNTLSTSLTSLNTTVSTFNSSVQVFAKTSLPTCGTAQVLSSPDGVNLSCISVNTASVTSGTAITSGDIATTGNFTTSGYITASNDISTRASLMLYDLSTGTHKISLQAPSAGLTDYTIVLPTTIGTTSQILTISSVTAGVANLGWSTPAEGSVAPGDASYAIKGLVQADTNAATSGLNLSAGIISVNSGTSANQLVKLNGSGQLPAISGVNLNNLNASNISTGTLAYAQLPIGIGANTVAAGNDSRFTDTRAPSGTASGDLSGSYPNPTVDAVKGKSVSVAPTTSGQVLRYDGTAWTPNFVSMFDLRSGVTGSQAFSGVGCTSGQTLTWTAATDNLSCTAIAVSESQVSGTLAASRFPALVGDITTVSGSLTTTIATDAVTTTKILDGAITTSKLASDIGSWVTDGTNAYRNTGNIGIGTISSDYKLDINGTTNITASTAGGPVLLVTNTEVASIGSSAIQGKITTNQTGTAGVYGLATGNGYVVGVKGYASNSSGYGMGVFGTSAAGSGIGVYGTASYTGSAAASFGGKFSSASPIGYALHATNSASTGNAIALYATTSSGTGFAIYSATGQNYFSGNVGIGTTNPASTLQVGVPLTGTTPWSPMTTTQTLINDAPTTTASGNVISLNVQTQPAPSANSSSSFHAMHADMAIPATSTVNYGGLYGAEGSSTNYGSGTVGTLLGGRFQANNASSTATANTITGLWSIVYNSGSSSTEYGLRASAQNSGGTLSTQYGIYSAGSNSAGTITNAYGMYITGFASGGATYTNTPYDVYAADSGAYNYFAGNVGIGTLTPAYKLDVDGDINTSTCFRIGATTVSGTCTSDERLKENIQDYNQGLHELLGIRLRTYQFNGLGEMPRTGQTAVGVIAQEVEQTNPELVKTRMVKMHPDDQEQTEIKVVDYSKFTYMLINAVKDLYQEWFKDSASIHRELASVNAKSIKLEAENIQLKQENAEIKSYLCNKDPNADFCK